MLLLDNNFRDHTGMPGAAHNGAGYFEFPGLIRNNRLGLTFAAQLELESRYEHSVIPFGALECNLHRDTLLQVIFGLIELKISRFDRKLGLRFHVVILCACIGTAATSSQYKQ